jgi:hypothetical protein
MEVTAEQKLYADLVQKAWEDANFKKALVENPVAAIESFTGQKLNLATGKTLVVTDQTDEQTVYFNIPATPDYANLELNEEQLEAVAGGEGSLGDYLIDTYKTFKGWVSALSGNPQA